MNEIQIGDGEKSKKKRLKSHIEEPKKRWGFDPLDAFAGTGYDPEFRAKFAEDYSEQVNTTITNMEVVLISCGR
ncbi:MAG: hypothetical protein WAV32_09400 [Halobacteriota archaeon]